MSGLSTSGGVRVRSLADGEKNMGGLSRVSERRSSTSPVRCRSSADAGCDGSGVGSGSPASIIVGSASAATGSATAGSSSTISAAGDAFSTMSSSSAAASASRAAELASLVVRRARREDARRLPKDATSTTRVASRLVPTRVATTAVAPAERAIAALDMFLVSLLPRASSYARGRVESA